MSKPENSNDYKTVEEEDTPKLFSDDQNPYLQDQNDLNNTQDTEKLFDQDQNEDEDFEILPFYRRQKF